MHMQTDMCEQTYEHVDTHIYIYAHTYIHVLISKIDLNNYLQDFQKYHRSTEEKSLYFGTAFGI